MVEDIQEIEKKVKEVLERNLNVNKKKLTLDSSLVDDLGMDSFTSIELVFELEEKLGIDIPEEDARKLITVGDVVSYITSRVSKKNCKRTPDK